MVAGEKCSIAPCAPSTLKGEAAEIEHGKRNVYLVGLMGAGKTTLGRAIARRLGYVFVDSDQEVESRTGVSLTTVFEIEGEDGFRKREAQVIAELAKKRGRVVATGGGAVLRPENRANLAASGIVVYLDVPANTLYERTRHDKARPLLQVEDPLQKLQELHTQRDPCYREIADIVISGSRITAQAVLQSLASQDGEKWKR